MNKKTVISGFFAKIGLFLFSHRSRKLIKIVVASCAAVLLIFLGFVAFLLWDKGRELDLNEAINAASGRTQRDRMILMNAAALVEINSPNAVVNLSIDQLRYLLKSQLTHLQGSAELQQAGLSLADPDVSASDQAINIGFEFSAKLNGFVVRGKAKTVFFAATTGDHLVFNGFIDRFVVDEINGGSVFSAKSVLSTEVVSWISKVRPLLNVWLDSQVNKPGKLSLPLRFGPVYQANTKDLGTSSLKIVPREIKLDLAITDSVFRVLPNGATLLAHIEPKEPSAQPVFTLPKSVILSDYEAGIQIAEFQRKFSQIQTQIFPPSDSPGKGSYFALRREFVASALNTALQGPPFVGQGNFDKAPSVSSFDIDLPAPSQRKCEDWRKQCSYKSVCENRESCERKIERIVQESCKVPEQITEEACRWITLGGIIPGTKRLCDQVTKTVLVDSTCAVNKLVTEVVQTPTCEAFVQTQKIDPLICNTVSNLDKAICDSRALLDEGLCTAEQGLRDFISHNPVGVVQISFSVSDSRWNMNLGVPQMASNLGAISAVVSGDASAKVGLGMHYDNRAPVLCRADWAHDYSFSLNTIISNLALSFNLISASPKDNKLIMTYELSEQSIPVDLNEDPFSILFGQNPALVVNCPLLVGGALLFGAYDTIVNEKLKKASPYLTGKGVPMKIKGASFDIVVDGIDGTDIGVAKLHPELKNTLLVFSQ